MYFHTDYTYILRMITNACHVDATARAHSHAHSVHTNRTNIHTHARACTYMHIPYTFTCRFQPASIHIHESIHEHTLSCLPMSAQHTNREFPDTTGARCSVQPARTLRKQDSFLGAWNALHNHFRLKERVHAHRYAPRSRSRYLLHLLDQNYADMVSKCVLCVRPY